MINITRFCAILILPEITNQPQSVAPPWTERMETLPRSPTASFAAELAVHCGAGRESEQSTLRSQFAVRSIKQIVRLPPHSSVTLQYYLQVCSVLCGLVGLALAAPAPEPFLLPTVSGALTLTVPALTIPGLGVTVTGAAIANALAAKVMFYIHIQHP